MAHVTIVIALVTGVVFAAGSVVELARARREPTSEHPLPAGGPTRIAGWTGLASLAFVAVGLLTDASDVAFIDLVALPLLGLAAFMLQRMFGHLRWAGVVIGALVTAAAATCVVFG